MVTTTDLPWCRTRAILLVLLLVACILGGGPCLQMFLKQKQIQNLINKTVPSPLTVVIRHKDVEITAIFVFLAAQLGIMIASPSIFYMIQDVYHIVPVALARRFKLDKRLSISTLTYQAWGFMTCAIVLAISLGVHTFFVFTRSAKLIVFSGGTQVSESTVQPYLTSLDIDLRYRKTPYILPTAEMPWAMVPILFLTALMTFIAARKRTRTQAAAVTFSLDESRAGT